LSRIEDLIERYFDNMVSEEERSEVLKLIQEGRIEETVKDKIAQTLSYRLRARELPDFEMSAKGEEIFKSILRKTAPPDKGPLPPYNMQRGHVKKSERNFSVILSYAAVFIVLLIGGLFAYPWKTLDSNKIVMERSPTPTMIKVVNSASAAKKVTLQDGSTVILEPGGELRYNEKFLNRREVYLSGDAFFEVTKDAAHPFLVFANEITTKVLGTSFRIKANQGEKEIIVAVKTGRVSVMTNSGRNDVLTKKIPEITLTPNQQAIYKRNEHIVLKKIVDEPEVIKGHAVLKDSYVNESVVLILEALTESYGVDIRFDKESLSDCTLTSDVIEGEGLYDQLEIVCNALGGTYKMENDASIVIEASGCQSVNVKP
jgi:transmembrane sensor